jgi:hypothetical protein
MFVFLILYSNLSPVNWYEGSPIGDLALGGYWKLEVFGKQKVDKYSAGDMSSFIIIYACDIGQVKLITVTHTHTPFF